MTDEEVKTCGLFDITADELQQKDRNNKEPKGETKMEDNYNEKLEKGKEITDKICKIFKDNDINLYNRFIDNTDSFKWELMTYFVFWGKQFKTIEEAVKGFIDEYDNRGAKFVSDKIEPCCELKSFDTKGENDE